MNGVSGVETGEPLTIFIIAGEPSGDAIGARLMAALEARTAGAVRFVGVGGERMAGEGLASIFPMSDISLFGAAEVLPKAPLIFRRIRQTVAAIRDHRPTLMILVPAMMQALIDHPAWPEIDFSCLRCVVTGSTTVPQPVLRAYLDRGIPIVQVYGSTETAPIVIHQRIAGAFDGAGSTGKAALHCEAEIRGPDGASLPPGENGEIVVRGPNIMTGYWNDPERTEQAVLRTDDSQWFRTGDNVYQDDDGYFFYVGRTDDIISSAGYRIGPQEVEKRADSPLRSSGERSSGRTGSGARGDRKKRSWYLPILTPRAAGGTSLLNFRTT